MLILKQHLTQFRQFNRIFARFAQPTEEGTRGDDCFVPTFAVGEEGNDVRHFLSVIATNGTTTEDTRAMGRTVTVPAVHG
jgi:hypothetical protein